MPKPKHILVIRLSAMGDVAMTVPVLRAFVTQYPEVHLTVLTQPFFKPLFRAIPNVSVYEADIKGKHKGVFGLWKLSRALKALHFDAVADLHNVLRSKILKVFFFGKPIVQIDKGRQEKKALVNGQSFKALKTTHQRYADVFEALGFPVDLSQPVFPKKAKLDSKYLEHIGTDTKPWIGIAPFAAFEGKMYPLDALETVISQLSNSYKILLFGAGNEEAQTLESISNRFDTVVNMAGKFSFEQELDIISNLDVMLAMDSGNAHLAAMLGVKVITIWGVTHPYAGFLPFNQSMDTALVADRKQYPKIPTSIYGNSFPKGYENAIRTVAPSTVVSKLVASLK
ncbi:glycosyltransferase family 9 protein [Psychroserpens sp. SPM9]|uniref:glycosyltransferase family 9 protein n=1 Tax=Psychroserpens sp. SPM9 TaxID=2975598 RepID=UPI0021A82DA4|nr:glycosyltransferase family 9 protein [Psychroserpens sp. SPM9]MDG5491125.1 glycosyltransferase family 9 protein [Psychroserpens sp. SPM9]